MNWDVTAQAFNRKTMESIGSERTERITSSNKIFRSCKTFLDVRRNYESFWNDLEPTSLEVVYVRKVEEVQS
jgi:hypothetical protein